MSDKPQESATLELWNRVRTPTVSATKAAVVNGRTITQLDIMWLFKKATEIWGPAGQGWGWDIVEERYDQGRPIFAKQAGDTEDPFRVLGHEVVHTVAVTFWYTIIEPGNAKSRIPDQTIRRQVGPHYGHTPFVYWSRKYVEFAQDEEAAKKSVTDALKKCATALGFGADIWAGLFDDRAYVEGARLKQELEGEVDEKTQLSDDNRALFAGKAETMVNTMKLIPNEAAVRHFAERARQELVALARQLGYSKETITQYIDALRIARDTKIKSLQEGNNNG